MKTQGITYKSEVRVYLDGKQVGTIRELFSNTIPLYLYTPKGSKTGGDTFPTLAACKASLEG